MASASMAAARAAAIVANSATTTIEPFICARSRARSAASPTSRTRINQPSAISHKPSATSHLMHGPFPKGDVEVNRLVAAKSPELSAAADTIAEQASEQLIGRIDRLAIERQQQVANEHARLRSRA